MSCSPAPPAVSRAAGADFLLLCTTTFHMVADQVRSGRRHPAAAPRRRRRGGVQGAPADQSVALLGTTFAMSRTSSSPTVSPSHGLTSSCRPPEHHESINPIDLRGARARPRAPPRRAGPIVGLVDELWDAGAGGLILGCTELELLIHQADVDSRSSRAPRLHVEAALDRALSRLHCTSPSRKAPPDRARQVLFVTDYRERSRRSSARRRSSGVRCCSGTVARVPPTSKT